MNVIDALVITLGLDDAQFQAKLEKSFKSLTNFAKKEEAVERKRSKDDSEQKRKASEIERKQHLERERQIKTATEGYKKLSGAIVGMVGAMAGMAGMKAFITGSMNSLLGVGRASQNLRMSARDVAAWGKTIEAVGGKSEDMIATMRSMDLAIVNYKKGFNVDNPFVAWLNNQGINLQNADGSVRTMGEMLPEIADAFNKFTPEDQTIMPQKYGWSDDFVTLLRKGGEELRRMQQEKLAQVAIDEDAIRRAEALQAAWSDVKGRLEKVRMALFEKLMPYLEKAVGHLERFSKWVEANSGRISEFFSGLGDVLGGIVDFLRDMHEKTDGWSTKILAAVAAFTALKGVLGSILSMTGLPMLVKLLGGAGSAGGGLSLAGLGKLGAVGAAGALGWGVGSLVSEGIEGTEASNVIGRTIAKGLAFFGHSDSKEALNAEARANGKALPYPELDRIEKTGKAQVTAAAAQLEETKTGNRSANEQTDWLKRIEGGISRMNNAFSAGYNGLPKPENGGIAGDVGYSAGSVTGAIVNSALGQVMKKAEGDYGVVNTGKRGGYKAARVNLEGMTVAQVMDAQTRGDFNAAGRYQIIGSTLRDAAKTLGLSGNEMFDKAMQDRIFVEYLLKHKRKAIWNYINGKSDDLHGAMLALSQEWASFADPRTGKSYYDGDGVNRASVGINQAAALLQQARAQMTGLYTGNRSEVQINGGITINTAATDANGIAQEIRPAVNRSLAGVTALGMA
jgi:hypothetical protein